MADSETCSPHRKRALSKIVASKRFDRKERVGGNAAQGREPSSGPRFPVPGRSRLAPSPLLLTSDAFPLSAFCFLLSTFYFLPAVLCPLPFLLSAFSISGF